MGICLKEIIQDVLEGFLFKDVYHGAVYNAQD